MLVTVIPLFSSTASTTEVMQRRVRYVKMSMVDEFGMMIEESDRGLFSVTS